jgi:hypothetical protein
MLLDTLWKEIRTLLGQAHVKMYKILPVIGVEVILEVILVCASWQQWKVVVIPTCISAPPAVVRWSLVRHIHRLIHTD